MVSTLEAKRGDVYSTFWEKRGLSKLTLGELND